jgi:hypothetical protein
MRTKITVKKPWFPDFPYPPVSSNMARYPNEMDIAEKIIKQNRGFASNGVLDTGG